VKASVKPSVDKEEAGANAETTDTAEKEIDSKKATGEKASLSKKPIVGIKRKMGGLGGLKMGGGLAGSLKRSIK